MGGVAVRQRGHADVGDVPEPRSRRAEHADRVRDVLAVRPGLHQPGGDRRCRAHRRPEPWHPCRRVEAREGRQQASPGAVEPVTKLARTKVPVPRGDRVRVLGTAGQTCPDRGKLLATGRRGRRGLVEVGEVRDLVANGPARCRGELLPLAVGQPIKDLPQRCGLVVEVGEQGGDVSWHQAAPQ